jgi:hypothetical protein
MARHPTTTAALLNSGVNHPSANALRKRVACPQVSRLLAQGAQPPATIPEVVVRVFER